MIRSGLQLACADAQKRKSETSATGSSYGAPSVGARCLVASAEEPALLEGEELLHERRVGLGHRALRLDELQGGHDRRARRPSQKRDDHDCRPMFILTFLKGFF